MGTIRKILLTGATGYLGKNLLKRLLDEGYDVSVLVRTRSNILEIKEFKGKITIYNVDESSLDEVFSSKPIDVIIHTAASYGKNGQTLEEILQSNVMFPIEILEKGIKNKVKYFVNTDTSLPKEVNAYSRSKKQFLEWLETCSSKINFLNLQLEYFYGPGDSSSKFITYVLNELTSGVDYINFTEATSFRDFVYIEDVVSAYTLLLKNIEDIGNKTIPIGSGKAFMLKDLVLEMQTLTGSMDVKLNFGAIPMRDNEIMHSCADITFLEGLGWKPTHTFKDGVLKMIKIENNLL